MENTDTYIGDAFGDFGVTVSAKETTPVSVEIQGDEFIKPSKIDAEVKAGKKVEIFPRIIYDYPALEKLEQPQTANVTFRLYVKDKLLKEAVQTVRFHSVNEVPFFETSRWNSKERIDNRWLFAAYVNEDDPFIDKILKEALQIGIADKIGYGNMSSFSGYQDLNGDGKTVEEVNVQVLAVWSVFQHHHIEYSNAVVTSTGSQNLLTQYVRTPEESFTNNQANCVDGTVLFASVLRRIGINVNLVILPDHMFLQYYVDAKGNMFNCLETTMLGTPASSIPASFDAAVNAGNREWNTVAAKIQAKDPSSALLHIAALRAAGVMPVRRY
jgi:hypothetical protein